MSPDGDPRLMDPSNADDNAIMYKFYHTLDEFLSPFNPDKIAEMAVKGTLYQEFVKAFPTIKPVNMLQNNYYIASSNEMPYIWYDVAQSVVPGNDDENIK